MVYIELFIRYLKKINSILIIPYISQMGNILIIKINKNIDMV